MQEKMLEELEERLNSLGIYDIRQIARAAGVHRPSDGKKGHLIGCLMKIASGEADPVPRTLRGAPHKSDEYDRALYAELLKCREYCLALKSGAVSEDAGELLSVGSGDDPSPVQNEVCGILEKRDGKWFIRGDNSRVSLSDVYVHESFVNRFKLREADLVAGMAKRESSDEMAGLMSVTAVNGASPDANPRRPEFDALTALYPSKRLVSACGKGDVAGRLIDMVSPVAAGQRALVTAPYGVDKTALLRHIAAGIDANNPDIKTVILLADALPESVTEYRRTLPRAEYFYAAGSTAEAAKTAELALEYAKRQVERGFDAVLVVDDMTRLARIFGITDTGHTRIRKIFSSARNAEEGGSLTIITGVTCGSGNPADEEVVHALADMCSMCVTLSRELSRAHVYPPVDIGNSGACYEERFLNCDHLRAVERIREKYGAKCDVDKLIWLIKKYDDESGVFGAIVKG